MVRIMQVIDGKLLAQKQIPELRAMRNRIKSKPRLAAVLVGEHSGSKKFLELKQRALSQLDIDFRLYQFPDNISNTQLREKLNQIARVKTNSAVLLELPLPAHLNSQYLLNTIPEQKDVDVLSQKSQGAFFAGRSRIWPPAVEAVRIILDHLEIDPKGRTVAVFGYGLLIGKPISHWLLSKGATVSVLNEWTKNPLPFCQNADILISGVGKPYVITSEMVKEGSVVIDFGFNEIMHQGTDTKKITGDVDFEAVKDRAGAITPVPAGVGPLVVTAVVKNVLQLAPLNN